MRRKIILMKRLFLIILMVFTGAVMGFGQITITQEGEVDTCSGSLSLGTPSTGTTYVFTLCSNDTANGNTHMSIDFSSYDISNGTLCAYDGNTTSANSLGCNAWTAGDSIMATDTNSTGCLTFTYRNDDASGDNFNATIHCHLHCQNSSVEIVSSTPSFVVENDHPYINICKGDEINFTVKGNYENNTYSQNDASSTIYWDFGDNTDTSGINLLTTTHTFTEKHGYNVIVYLKDSKGCISEDTVFRVRVGLKPNFANTHLEKDAICPGMPDSLYGTATEEVWNSKPTFVFADTVPLHDGTGVSDTSTITIDQFTAGQTLSSLSELEGICMNIEHSYLGDLSITVICPDGHSVSLKDFDSDVPKVFFGEARPETDTIPGKGWQYCVTPSPTYGTFNTEATHANTVTIDGYNILKTGTYTSQESLNGLVGCPLNGEWKLIITDHQSGDNGTLFSWWINFATSLYPDIWDYSNTLTGEKIWLAPNAHGEITDDGSSDGNGLGTYYKNIDHLHQTNEPFVYKVKDNYGCYHDTTINVIVYSDTHNMPPLDILTPDTTVCGKETMLRAYIDTAYSTGTSDTNHYHGTWRLVSGPDTVSFSDTTAENTSVIVSKYGTYVFKWFYANPYCDTVKEITVVFNPLPTDSFTATVPYCAGFPTELTVVNLANDDDSLVTYHWIFPEGYRMDSITDISYAGKDTGLYNDNSLNSHFYVAWQNSSDTVHVLALVKENKWGCKSDLVYDTIKMTKPLQPESYDSINATCGNPNGAIVLHKGHSSNTFEWLPVNYIPFANPYDSSQSELYGGVTYQIIVDGPSLSPDAPSGFSCADTFKLYLPDTGHTVADFDTTNLVDGIGPYTVALIDQSENAVSYQWYLYYYDEDSTMIVDSSTEVSPAFTIEETGDYGIILTTTSAEGCTSTKDWKGFHVDAASSLDIPNVFTPNGDGVNDYFQVKAVSMETFNGVILDRWGRKIFEWTNCKEETAGWDGTNGSSKAAPGVYFYIIKAVGKDEVTYDESGTLYLFRDKQ